MDIKRFEEIMKDSTIGIIFREGDKDQTLIGLNIIAKYLPESGIEGADHDIIYSVDCINLVEAGITEEDTIKLREMNWMIKDDYLACYV